MIYFICVRAYSMSGSDQYSISETMAAPGKDKWLSKGKKKEISISLVSTLPCSRCTDTITQNTSILSHTKTHLALKKLTGAGKQTAALT